MYYDFYGNWRWTLTVAISLVCFVLPQVAQAQDGKRAVLLRAGCGFVKGDIFCTGVDKFAEEVEQRSRGQLKVQVFYRELGAEHQLTQSVMSGAVDMGMITGGNAARFSPAFLLYDLPFLFKSYKHVLDVLDGPIGQKSIEQFERDLGVKMLLPIGPGSGRDVQTTKRLARTPSDLAGMKIRVVSTPVDLATFRAWGANPTPLDWGQTYAALQQGLVEGIGISAAALLSSKFYEAARYYTVVDYQPIWENFFMNRRRFSSLSAQHQKILTDAAAQTNVWHRAYAAKFADEALDKLRKLGVEVYVPTPQERAQWTAVREKIWRSVAEEEKGIDLRLANQIYESQK